MADPTAESPLQYLTSVLDKLEQGVVLIDEAGVLIAVNEAMAETLGAPSDVLMSLPSAALVAHVLALTDSASGEPPRLLPEGHGIVCQEFEVVRPSRSVLRWVAQLVDLPTGEGVLVVCTDITAEVDLAAAHERLALTDRLTGLVNRRGGEDSIARELARAQRDSTPLSLVLLDIDHFKRINDVHGHAEGDRVLRDVARVISGAVRRSDLAIRWGGEEFVLVLPGATLEGARITAERLRALIARAVPSADAHPVTVSMGIGVAAAGERAELVLARADARMYVAKRAGRDRVC